MITRRFALLIALLLILTSPGAGDCGVVQFNAVTPVGGGGITIQNRQTVGGDSGNYTSIEITKPNDCVDGDVFYAFISKDDDKAIDTLSGWTELDQLSTTDGQNGSTGVFRKVIADCSAEGPTYTFTFAAADSEQRVGSIQNLRGVDNTTPEDAAAVITNVEARSPSSVVVPGLTTQTANAVCFAYLGVHMAGTTTATVTAPAGHTDLGELVSSSGGGGAFDNLSYFTQAVAGATGDQTWTDVPTTTNLKDHGFLVCVRPA